MSEDRRHAAGGEDHVDGLDEYEGEEERRCEQGRPTRLGRIRQAHEEGVAVQFARDVQVRRTNRITGLSAK